jgi:hypothetical protein
MALWGNLDASNNAPIFADTGGYGATANTQDASIFGNVTIGATRTDVAMGMFGVDTTEKSVTTGDGANGTHAGWVLRTAYTGPVTSITANAGAVGVNSYVTFTGGSSGAGAGLTGNTSANAIVSVNSTGHIVSVTLVSGGVYANTPVATPNTGNAAFTLTMGGRANRVFQETLVAMGSIYGDATTPEDSNYPDA